MNKFIVSNEYSNLRLDKFLSIQFSDLSRTHIAKIIEEGNCLVNSKVAKAGLKLKGGDEVEINIPEVKPLEIKKEDIPLDVVYEDEDILIINKPQGMVVHPANGNYEHTLVNAVLNYSDDLSGINGVARPGIVHLHRLNIHAQQEFLTVSSK